MNGAGRQPFAAQTGGWTAVGGTADPPSVRRAAPDLWGAGDRAEGTKPPAGPSGGVSRKKRTAATATAPAPDCEGANRRSRRRGTTRGTGCPDKAVPPASRPGPAPAPQVGRIVPPRGFRGGSTRLDEALGAKVTPEDSLDPTRAAVTNVCCRFRRSPTSTPAIGNTRGPSVQWSEKKARDPSRGGELDTGRLPFTSTQSRPTSERYDGGRSRGPITGTGARRRRPSASRCDGSIGFPSRPIHVPHTAGGRGTSCRPTDAQFSPEPYGLSGNCRSARGKSPAVEAPSRLLPLLP